MTIETGEWLRQAVLHRFVMPRGNSLTRVYGIGVWHAGARWTNQFRGLLLERGIIFRKGRPLCRDPLLGVLEDPGNGLSDAQRMLLAQVQGELRQLQSRSMRPMYGSFSVMRRRHRVTSEHLSVKAIWGRLESLYDHLGTQHSA
jgi:hypothetical protein